PRRASHRLSRARWHERSEQSHCGVLVPSSRIHRGVLRLHGTAPDDVHFDNVVLKRIELTPIADRLSPNAEQARGALRYLGFRAKEAATLVERALTHVGSADLNGL